MANWNIGLFTKYAGAGRNDMAVALSYPATWTNVGEQSDANVSARRALSYCTLALGLVDDATLAAIQADTHYLILVRWEEVAQDAVPSFDNRQTPTITTTQRNVFVSYFSTEFGIDVSKIPVIQNGVGRSRGSVLLDIVANIRNL